MSSKTPSTADLVRPRLQLAHAGRVDQEGAARAARRAVGMSWYAVPCRRHPAPANLLHLAAQQPVDQRGLPDAGRPKQRNRRRRRQVRDQRVQAVGVQGAHSDHVHKRKPLPHGLGCRHWIFAEVGLVQYDDRRAPASHTIVRYRSSRRGFKSPASAVTRKMVSTLAASTCSPRSGPRPSATRCSGARAGNG